MNVHRNSNRITKRSRHINHLIRKNCCWNCLQLGHMRFQCPFPRMIRCSFCRKPFVLSVNCTCRINEFHEIPEQEEQVVNNEFDQVQDLTRKEQFNNTVLVPKTFKNGSIHS